MDVDGNARLRFGEYKLDTGSGKLLREGLPVKIQPQPLRVLMVLLEQPGEIVSREYLQTRIWGEATFVEFDQGLNYCIRHIRLALRDGASSPLYIETLPKQGYRFIARVSSPMNGAELDRQTAMAAVSSPERRIGKQPIWRWVAVVCVVVAFAGVAVYTWTRQPPRPVAVTYEQLTDFTDSAVSPALSPDGRVVAFIRGSVDFLSDDEIYAKVLPNGEAKRLTDDPRPKYGLSFSPDGAQIAYTVMDPPVFSTYVVSTLGGDSHLLLHNSAGLSWLNEGQVLFSESRAGLHLGVVTGTVTREHARDIYFPAHERGMAHYSHASPDRKSVLVVEMDEQGQWTQCRVVSLDGLAPMRSVGPAGGCTSAGWSPDGSWMFFSAEFKGQSHLWRQRFPDGQLEQMTYGPMQEGGVAVEPDGRALITSAGVRESALYLHDNKGERCLSYEGEIIAWPSRPSFSADGQVLYYLLQRQDEGRGPELWRMDVASGKGEAVFPGVSMLAFNVSPDGKSVVYSAPSRDGQSQLWTAPVDRASPAQRIGRVGETTPYFGPRGQILFRLKEGKFNYLARMNPDGSGRSKLVAYPILDILGISPSRRWVDALVPVGQGSGAWITEIPVEGGAPRQISSSYLVPAWSSNGRFLFVPVEAGSRNSPGRSLAIPVGPGESLPQFPPGGIEPLAKPAVVQGSQSVNRADLIPGPDITRYAYVNTTAHRNLYRISLP